MMKEEYRIMNNESGRKILVLCTSGYYAVSYSTYNLKFVTNKR